jgi:hypothetical protein
MEAVRTNCRRAASIEESSSDEALVDCSSSKTISSRDVSIKSPWTLNTDVCENP